MAAVNNSHWRIDYLNINMDATRNRYLRASADRAMLCAIPVIVVLGLLETIRNVTFAFANCAIAVINAGSFCSHKIRSRFSPAVVRHSFSPSFTFGSQVAHSVRSEPVPERPWRDWRGPVSHRGAPLLGDLFLREPPVAVNGVSPSLLRRAQPASLPNQQPAPLPNQQFTPDELGVLRAAFRIYQRPVETLTGHVAWYDFRSNSIKIQDIANHNARNQENLLDVAIDEPGRITRITINGVNHDRIPDEFLPGFRKGLAKSLEISSKYAYPRNEICIEIIRRGLKEIPVYHLERLTQILGTYPTQPIVVRFLKNDMTFADGSDAGGLSRDYFDDLFAALTKENGSIHYWKNRSTNLLMPSAEEGAHSNLPDLTFREEGIYKKMGQVMMYCYLNADRPLLIGKRFDTALFKAAFSLTDDELGLDFDQLPIEAKLKMAENIATANDEPPQSIRLIQLAIKGRRISPAELKEVETFLNVNGDLPPDFDHEHFDAANLVQKEIVMRSLIDVIFAKEGVGKSLAAIHAIAKGMRQTYQQIAPQYVRFQNIDANVFDTKIQGSIDRREIARALQLKAEVEFRHREALGRKLTWLQEWIRGEATEEELRKWIKLVGGASSLPVGCRIGVKAQTDRALPVPVAHSCFFEIDLSPFNCSYGRYNDHTEAEFIRAVKELALADPGSYSFT